MSSMVVLVPSVSISTEDGTIAWYIARNILHISEQSILLLEEIKS